MKALEEYAEDPSCKPLFVACRVRCALPLCCAVLCFLPLPVAAAAHVHPQNKAVVAKVSGANAPELVAVVNENIPALAEDE